MAADKSMKREEVIISIGVAALVIFEPGVLAGICLGHWNGMHCKSVHFIG